MRVAILAVAAAGFAAPSVAAASKAEEAAIFKAAGFVRHGKEWRDCGPQLKGAAYESGRIKIYKDINGDGRPEAIVTEGSAVCYGNTGTQFTLLTRSARGAWVKLYQSLGYPKILKSRFNGWPEIAVGVPGLCRPILRYKGRAYAIARREGENCRS